MKAVLEFDLDNPDDAMAHMRCVKAKDMALMLFEFDQHLRGQYKHSDSKEAGIFREQLNTMMRGYNIDLDELIN